MLVQLEVCVTRVNAVARLVTQMQPHKALKLHCGWIEDL